MSSPMTSRQRLLAVLNHQQPDRVPIAEMWIAEPVARAICGKPDTNAAADALGLDNVVVATMVYEDDEVEWIDRSGQWPIYRDKWGVQMIKTADGMPLPHGEPRIGSPEDLARYTPPDPRQSPVPERIRRVRQHYPDRAVCVVAESGWAPAVFLRGGLENFLMDVALEPDFICDLMKIGADYYAELLPLCLDAGADLVFLGDDYSDKNGPMISPKHFEQLVLPADAQVISAVKSAGGYVIKHTDGNIRLILEMLLSTGLDALGPLEDVPAMNLRDLIDAYGDRAAMMGNLSLDLLGRGTRDQVVAATKKLLAEASSTGRHILSSGNTVSTAVQPDNYRAMVETAAEFGSFPIPETIT
jgi:uroporphyrinogen decarboxylase